MLANVEADRTYIVASWVQLDTMPSQAVTAAMGSKKLGNN